MNIIIKIRSLLFASILFLVSTSLFAQSTQSNATANTISISIPAVLSIISILLFLIIWVLGRALFATITYYREKNKKGSSTLKALSIIITILFFSAATACAEPIKSTPQVVMETLLSKEGMVSLILLFVIVLELTIILLFVNYIKYFSGVKKFEEEKQLVQKSTEIDPLIKIWEKINQFKPIEEEEILDTGHSYDGIRELDNVTPPWFKVAFAASIVFAIIYLWRYHVASSAPLQIQEYEMEVTEAKRAHEVYLKQQTNLVDENSVKMLGTSDIQAGALVYKTNCIACHGDQGQGGVGPNLTDNYWLHGGDIKDIFKSIKYGWQEKGMKPWKDDFSPSQIAQLTSFVKSLNGTNPASAKDPQGELYTPSVPIPIKADSVVAPVQATIK